MFCAMTTAGGHTLMTLLMSFGSKVQMSLPNPADITFGGVSGAL